MTRVEGQPGWVLHRRPWGESSFLIEFFSRDHGRIGLVGKGARSARSQWRGLVEPFCPLSASWTRRGEMGTLIMLEPAGSRCVLEGRALWCGLYANELLIRLVARDDPAPPLFEAYSSLLPRLADPADQARTLRRFELVLLESMGIAPDLASDADAGEPIRSDRLYHLDPDVGLVPVDRPARSVFRGSVIRGLLSDSLESAEDARMARSLTRILIEHQLDGRPLQTRRLLENHRGGQTK